MAAALNIDGNNVEAIVDMGQQGEAVAYFSHARSLCAAGVLTGGMAAAAAVYRSPPHGTFLARGGGLGYYLVLGAAFAAGVADVWAALWVAGDTPGRRAVGTKLLCASSVPS